MDCAKARARLLEYREGQLDIEGKMRLEAHLLICGSCLDEFQTIDALLAAVAAIPAPDPRVGFARRVRARIESEERRGSQGSGWWGVRSGWALACVAVFLLLGGGAVRSAMPPAKAGIAAVGSEGTTAPDDAVWDAILKGDMNVADLILRLWPGREPDLTALSEGGERRLASLAMEGEEVDIEDALRLSTPALPGRSAMEALTGMMELSGRELEKLLAKLRSA